LRGWVVDLSAESFVNKNLGRCIAPVVLCAFLVPSGAIADGQAASEAASVPIDRVTELYRVDQSERLAALTDEQVQAILGRVENHREDAFDVASRRRGKDFDREYYGAKKN
jgi:hypothetical protein